MKYIPYFTFGFIFLKTEAESSFARNIPRVAFVTYEESGSSSKYCQPRDYVRMREGVNLFTGVPLFIFSESKNIKHE